MTFITFEKNKIKNKKPSAGIEPASLDKKRKNLAF